MARVLGIGGVFFKCEDKDKLAQWYKNHLGFVISDHGGLEFDLSSAPKGGYCVWGPFAKNTEYFAPSNKEFMINLMVDDVDAVLAKAKQGGAEVMEEKENCEFGRFGWFIDPEGNKIELWEPNPDFEKPN